MGIGPAARELYEQLNLKPGRICELGSQDIHFEGGIGLSAREWMEARGWDYTCIDTDGHASALRLDLNTCSALDVGVGCANAFDVVTNHGTSEHVFNQHNVFKLMHDLTKLDGIMIHAVPTPKFGRPHGFYTYDEIVFHDLAYANNYEIERMYRKDDPYEIILVVLRKIANIPFDTPQQGMYRR
jgi:SAM-dependent methyltransferase